MPGCSVCTIPFFVSRNVMLTMLVCATRWLFMHLYTLVHMSMHESCLLMCHPCFNTMKLWTSNPNLHLSLADTTFCLPSCLFVFMLRCLPCLSCLTTLCLFICFASFPSIACLLVSCLCLCMYTHEARMLGARAQSLKLAKRARMQACRYKPSGMFNRFRSLAFPFWLCTLLNSLPPTSFLS